MKYKLLKDTPMIKAGTIGYQYDLGYKFYVNGEYGEYEYYVARVVESSPEWFEPVIERWRAKKWEEYFYVNADLFITKVVDDGFGSTQGYLAGNYFKTQEQAEEASKRINKCLMDYHAEIGE